jgi:hypothetical protein
MPSASRKPGRQSYKHCALLFTTPAFTSACVIVCEPVQVVLAPGAKVVAAQMAAALSCASTTAMPVKVTLPVLVTRKL